MCNNNVIVRVILYGIKFKANEIGIARGVAALKNSKGNFTAG